MMFLSKKLVLFLVLALCSQVFCEDEMSLHVSIIENSSVESTEDGQNSEDICSGLKCDLGEKCNILDNHAVCDCIDVCEDPKDERQKICTSANNTFESDCHFYRQKCWCQHNDAKCTQKSIVNEKLDYYGECRFIDQCSSDQKSVFPNRMKVWLDEVLHILSQRKDLESKYANLVQLADEMKQNNVEKYWTAGVIFEFCDLDKSKDHKIQKEELKLLVSSIKALESCIQPFLDECDKDGNDVISDEEWGLCLDLSPNDMKLLREKC